MKVLTGIYRKDAGTIWFKGQEVDVPDPRAGRDLGISMIHQELVLAPHLTVAQNIYMGREPRGRLSLHRRRQAPGRADRRAHRPAPPAARPARQGPRPQGRAAADGRDRQGPLAGRVRPHHGRTHGGPDEHGDRRALPHHPRPHAQQGVGVVHISHRLEELRQISDRVTVMRDGRHVATVETAAVSIDEIISMMVGRIIYEEAPQVPETPGPGRSCWRSAACLAAEPFRDVSFSCGAARSWASPGWWARAARSWPGSSSGRTARTRATSSSTASRSTVGSPADAVSPAASATSRRTASSDGLALGLDVEDNVALASYRRFLRGLGQVNTKLTRAAADAAGRGTLHQDPEHRGRRSATCPEGPSRRWSWPSGSRPRRRSSSSTSRLAASMSAPRARSTTCSTSLLHSGKLDHHDLLGAA